MPEDWLVLRTPVPPTGEIHLLVDALRRAGARAVEREGDRLAALFPATDAVAALVAEVRLAVRTSTDLSDPSVEWSRQSHAEWAARWRTEQAARRVSERVVVAPVGVDLAGPVGPVPGDDDVVVRLDPAVAFGTAEHATTRACLALLDRRVRAGERVLDVGTGSGILAIGAALLGAERVLALESDPVSCRAARRNVEVNGVAGAVEVRELEVGPPELERLGPCDGVVVNIEAGVSAPLVPAVPAALVPGGWLILSGVVGSEREDAVAAADRVGLRLVEERPVRSWWTGVFELDHGG